MSASSSEPFRNFTKYVQISKEKLVTAWNAATENNTNPIKSTPTREPVVVHEWYYKFDPNAETLYVSVHTTTTTTDTRSNNANTSTQNNISDESVYYDDFDPLNNNKDKTTRIECLTVNGSEKRKWWANH